MPPDPSFDALMARLRAGDEAAATEIFTRFSGRLLALARSRLGRLRHKEDPEDVVQSAYKSFFRRQAQGDFTFESWDSLLGLLVTITLHKCGHRLDYYQAGKRDVHREISQPRAAGDSTASWEAIAREPAPSEVAVLAETTEELFRGLDERQQQIVELALEGFGTEEISAQVCCTRRTVQRVLERVRRRLELQCARRR